MKKIFTKSDKQFIQDNYLKFGITYCANHLNSSVWFVNKQANKFGLFLTNKAISNIKKNSKWKKDNEYKVNPRGFIDFNSREHVYILGFLWADGHVNKDRYRINCCVQARDFKYLKSIFQSTGEWDIRNVTFRKKFKSTLAQTSNRTLWEFLVENDYLIKSDASPDKILSKIPENLRHYWWRGYFDGDGTIDIKTGSSRASIVSTYDQNWNFCENLFKELDILKFKINRKKVKGGKHSRVLLQNVSDCYRFLSYIYQDYDKIGFQRKYDKYPIIIQRYQYQQSRKAENLNIPYFDKDVIEHNKNRRLVIYDIINKNKNAASFEALRTIFPISKDRLAQDIKILKRDKKIKSINHGIMQVYTTYDDKRVV